MDKKTEAKETKLVMNALFKKAGSKYGIPLR
jgi:hypothetical protein